jgi:sporulation protein YlmC with PRC-barrel domain
MAYISRAAATASAITLIAAIPAAAEDSVDVLSTWTYDTLYAEGWSVENMFDATRIVDANGEDIGDVENVIFSNDGEVLGIIAQVGGFWDIGDTHVHVPWTEVDVSGNTQHLQVPVTEETVDDYDVFGGYWDDEQVITQDDTEAVAAVDDDLVAGTGLFKATDLIGDYAYLSDGVRYGYVADIVVQDGSISAVVTDATTYGRPGYYAFPYDRGARPMTEGRYDMGLEPVQIDKIDSFDYEKLRSRVTGARQTAD